MSKRIVVIMAGGKGERFWPLSRNTRPKQFLRLLGKNTLLEMTLDLAVTIPSVEQVWVVTGKNMVEQIRSICPELPPENILLEPVGRNSAPCLGLAAINAKKRLGAETTMLAMPADGLIEDKEGFVRRAEVAFSAAESGDWLLTFGIKPTRPETGYGYLELGEALDEERGIYRVKRFHEKPDFIDAKRYHASNEFLWNSGMFAFRADTFLSAVSMHAPGLAEGLARLEEALGTPEYPARLAEIFPTLPAESVDYAIMEKADNILTVRTDIGWDDIGNWDALDRLVEKDADGNVVVNRALTVESGDNIIVGEDVTIATLGVEGLIIVATKDAVLVTRKDQGHNIRKLIEKIKEDDELEGLL